MAIFELRGRIAATGFASGDRVVIGMWDASPIGPFADVMWAEPDGTRVLHAAPHAARFITAIYGFDRVEHTTVTATCAHRTLEVQAGPWHLTLRSGAAVPFPPRPSWVTRYVEAPIARRAMQVHTYGVSPSGVEEWYRARSVRRVREAVAAGPRPLGAMAPVTPRCGFGFSEPPAFPSLTEVRPRLRDRSGRLDAVVRELTP